MIRKAVSSSNIKSIGHDAIKKILEVEFHDGGVYQYQGVEAKSHQDLINADSIGSHFHKNIKDKFKVTRMNPKQK